MRDEINLLLAPASPQSPRQTEASIVALSDGRLLAAWSDFYGGKWGDHAPARILGRWSDDGGESWAPPVVLQENLDSLNCMSASLLQLPGGRILLAFGRKCHPPSSAGTADERPMLDAVIRISNDLGQSWLPPRNITPGGAYWCITNDRLVRLASGRLIYPISRADQGCHCWLSDDDGLSWRQAGGDMARPVEGASAYEEPTVVELSGGNVAMFIRTDAGNLHLWRSGDGGENWRPWKVHPPDMCGHADCGPNAARSPCMVKRLPATGDLLLVWNNNRVRSPLCSAISSDEGESWQKIRQVEPMDSWPPRLTHAYPSLAFQDALVHLTYWETHSEAKAGRFFHLRYRRLAVDWFYESDTSRHLSS